MKICYLRVSVIYYWIFLFLNLIFLVVEWEWSFQISDPSGLRCMEQDEQVPGKLPDNIVP